eukprot:IDg6541t1
MSSSSTEGRQNSSTISACAPGFDRARLSKSVDTTLHAVEMASVSVEKQ